MGLSKRRVVTLMGVVLLLNVLIGLLRQWRVAEDQRAGAPA